MNSFSQDARGWELKVKIQAFDEDLLAKASHGTKLKGQGKHYKKPLS